MRYIQFLHGMTHHKWCRKDSDECWEEWMKVYSVFFFLLELRWRMASAFRINFVFSVLIMFAGVVRLLSGDCRKFWVYSRDRNDDRCGGRMGFGWKCAIADTGEVIYVADADALEAWTERANCKKKNQLFFVHIIISIIFTLLGIASENGQNLELSARTARTKDDNNACRSQYFCRNDHCTTTNALQCECDAHPIMFF